MAAIAPNTTVSATAKSDSWFERRSATRTGVVLSVLAGLFLLFDSVTKLLRMPAVVAGTVQMGFPEHSVQVIGALLLFGVVLYTIPRTAALGALVITGYLGGAVCANLRMDMPLLGYQLFPIYLAVLLWGGLYLRGAALRDLVRVARPHRYHPDARAARHSGVRWLRLAILERFR